MQYLYIWVSVTLLKMTGSSHNHLPVVILRITIAGMKQHDQKHLGEESVYFIHNSI